MRINHNIAALNTYRQLTGNNNAASKSLEKLSSGLRINRAGDDAAGLAISEKMRGQIRGLEMASKNAQDGISLIQTAEGALNETHSILQRMRELAVQSANDTNTDADRAELQKEVNQLANALNDISKDTEFNTKSLLDGTYKGTFHVGANSGQNLEISIGNMSASSLNVGGVEGATFEVAASTVSKGSGLVAAGTYNVVTLDEDTSVNKADGTTAEPVKYGLQDASGKIVAVSKDGLEYAKLNASAEMKDLASAKVVVDFDAVDASNDNTVFGDAVISGTVEIAAAGAATATATVTTGVELADGSYTVVGTEHAGVANLGLVNDNGDLVALSDANGQVWKSYADSAKTVLTTVEKLVKDDEVAVGSGEGLNISTQKSADAAVTTIQSAIDTVSAERSKLGAVQNRLEHTINNLNTSSENLTAAESRIRDVDMAKEMMEFTKNNILNQAAQAMLAQANQQPQGVLQLLR